MIEKVRILLARIISRKAKTADKADTGSPNAGESLSALETAGKAGVSPLLLAFVQYFVSERPYLNPDLDINDVARALHTNRTYVSALVNRNFGLRFRDYLNSQRVNYSKKVLEEHPEMMLGEVAVMSGFTSDSRFVKIFKEHTGETPRAWQARRNGEKAG